MDTKKIFISSDIEGTCGICTWDETEKGSDTYQYFSRQMTRESAAAANAALDCGAEEVIIKDAHDSARNLIPDELPLRVKLLRGWTGDLLCMMSGLDKSFDAVAFTGYHDCATSNGNSLSHTMTRAADEVRLNGELASEYVLNSYIAAYYDVPVVFLSGDKSLCEKASTISPGIHTVAVKEGRGNSALSIHPDEACKRIYDGMSLALQSDYRETCKVTMPDRFTLEVRYSQVSTAYRSSFYPGAQLTSGKVVKLDSTDYMDILRYIHFCL